MIIAIAPRINSVIGKKPCFMELLHSPQYVESVVLKAVVLEIVAWHHENVSPQFTEIQKDGSISWDFM